MIQYDYEKRLEELQSGIDKTFKTILYPFIDENIESLYIKNNKINILDVGCGCGYLTSEISKKYNKASILGIDLENSAIECACKFNNNIDFKVSDIALLNDEIKYDVIIFNMVLHNVSLLENVIRKTSLLLTDNGIVIITIPHPCYWLQDKINSGKIVLGDVFDYFDEKEYLLPFQINNGNKHDNYLHYYHRQITTYINTFSKYLDIDKYEEVDIKNNKPTMLRLTLKKYIKTTNENIL